MWGECLDCTVYLGQEWERQSLVDDCIHDYLNSLDEGADEMSCLGNLARLGRGTQLTFDPLGKYATTDVLHSNLCSI